MRYVLVWIAVCVALIAWHSRQHNDPDTPSDTSTVESILLEQPASAPDEDGARSAAPPETPRSPLGAQALHLTVGTLAHW